MNATAHRASLVGGLASIVSLLVGCGGGTASPAIPASTAEFNMPNANAGITIWAAAEQTSKLFGISLDGKLVRKVVSTKRQPVKGGKPLTLKVDGQNLFVTDLSGSEAGVIQEYKNGGFVRAYSPSCPTANCSNFTGSLGDTVVDKSYVFAIMKHVQYKVGSTTDARTVVGDGTAGTQSKGWLDIGRVFTNHWRKDTNSEFTVPFSAAVYVPGD